MKTLIKIVTIFLMLFGVTLITPQKANAQGMPITFQVFYDELAPYGNWLYTPEYGYVWLPNAEPGFFPYATDGYWAYTDYGWTWVSFYTWGWAPFHYGRWFVDSTYGPMWVPGYDWAPAWVVWGVSGDCFGWAPLGPGESFEMAYGRHFHEPADYWRFVPERDFGRRNISNYYINNDRHPDIVNHYTLINNMREDRMDHVRYSAGPERREVERYTGRAFSPVAIRESSRPTQEMANNQLLLYKPRVEKVHASGMKPAPAHVANLQDLRNRAPENNNITNRNEIRSAHQKQVVTQSSKAYTKPEPVRQPRENPPARIENPRQFQHQSQPDGSKSFRQIQHEKPPVKIENPRQFQHQSQPDRSQSFRQIQRENPPSRTENIMQFQHRNPADMSKSFRQPRENPPAMTQNIRQFQRANPPATMRSFSRPMEIQPSVRHSEVRPMPQMRQMSRPENFSAQRGYSHYGGRYTGRQARRGS